MSAALERLNHLNLNHLYAFVAVAEHNSFTAAAEALGLSKSLLSEQLRRLEADLGIQLLTRTTRRMTLTDRGELLFGVAQRMLGELDGALSDVRDLQGEPSGRLRITAPQDFVKWHISSVSAAFIRQFPKVRWKCWPMTSSAIWSASASISRYVSAGRATPACMPASCATSSRLPWRRRDTSPACRRCSSRTTWRVANGSAIPA